MDTRQIDYTATQPTMRRRRPTWAIGPDPPSVAVVVPLTRKTVPERITRHPPWVAVSRRVLDAV